MKISWNYKEMLIILGGWLLVYASDPLYMFYNEVVGNLDFCWSKIFGMWKYTSAFLAIFLIHHFVLIPQFVAKKRYWTFGVCVAMCITAFVTFLIYDAPPFDHVHHTTSERP